MSAEPDSNARPALGRLWLWAAFLALGAGFVLIGGGNLDLGRSEARLGLSAAERLGPFGQVFGGWDPAFWPGEVAPSTLWAWGEGGTPSAASVRWPAAIAGVLIGLILARSTARAVGGWAGVLTALCWFGSVALIDRSEGVGLNLVAGLGTVAALDRILNRGSDTVAGLWAALAFLAGGWPPVALIALATVVIGRREGMLTPRLLLPPVAAAVAWSAWALSVTRAEVWGAALALPLTQKSAWLMVLGVVAAGMPWSPIAALVMSRSVRDGWSGSSRALVLGWLQVAGASLVVGTVIPGLASAARLPALAGLAVTAAACSERLWAGTVSDTARRGFLTLAGGLVAAWVVIAVAGGIYLGCIVPYYRKPVIVLVSLAIPMGLLALASVLKADPRRALIGVAAVAVCLKLGHWGIYVPERNYRFSQGPWGRAIGQWVPPNWPLYTFHDWNPDLAFATRRSVRQLPYPRLLAYQDGSDPKYVLLLDSEFEHWPKEAPALIPVAALSDEHGAIRIVARTEGVLPWDRLARRKTDE